MVDSHASAWERDNERRLRRLALALVAIGLLWRFSRYLLRFPIWGDEAMLLTNYFTKGYLDLFGSIDSSQIAPLLFHVSELAAFRWLGASELAVRLPAFLACVGSMVLFWRLSRVLPPLGRTLAVGIFSVSIWPATMGSLTKPYAFDLFFALALLTAAVGWLARPERLGPLLALVLVVPFAITASYPSVFVAGGVGLTLLPTVWKFRSPRVLLLFGLYGVLLIGSFAAHYLFVSLPHLASAVADTDTATAMTHYWEEGFPPHEPLRLGEWLILTHFGQMAAYPLGASNGGSALTVLLCLVGLAWLWRQGQWRLLILTAGTFGLWLLAAALRKYPYGASCRLSQHVAPFYCLLPGLGCSVLILRLKEESRWRAAVAAMVVLGLIGVGGTIRDFLRPYRDLDALWARAVTDDLMKRAGDDPIVAPQDVHSLTSVFQWQLGSHGKPVIYGPDIDWRRLGEGRSLWVFSFGEASLQDETAQLQANLDVMSHHTWRCVEKRPSTIIQPRFDDRLLHCRIYHWVRE
jgi:hypothetical protein